MENWTAEQDLRQDGTPLFTWSVTKQIPSYAKHVDTLEVIASHVTRKHAEKIAAIPAMLELLKQIESKFDDEGADHAGILSECVQIRWMLEKLK